MADGRQAKKGELAEQIEILAERLAGLIDESVAHLEAKMPELSVGEAIRVIGTASVSLGICSDKIAILRSTKPADPEPWRRHNPMLRPDYQPAWAVSRVDWPGIYLVSSPCRASLALTVVQRQTPGCPAKHGR